MDRLQDMHKSYYDLTHDSQIIGMHKGFKVCVLRRQNTPHYSVAFRNERATHYKHDSNTNMYLTLTNSLPVELKAKIAMIKLKGETKDD